MCSSCFDINKPYFSPGNICGHCCRNVDRNRIKAAPNKTPSQEISPKKAPEIEDKKHGKETERKSEQEPPEIPNSSAPQENSGWIAKAFSSLGLFNNSSQSPPSNRSSEDKFLMKPKDIRIGKILGRGSFGAVTLALIYQQRPLMLSKRCN